MVESGGGGGKGKRAVRILRLIALAAVALIVLAYILLASGLLGELPGRIAGTLASVNGSEVSFRGLRTNIFWSTRADTVIVADTTGLLITITDVDIRGNAAGFLFSPHMRSIDVGDLDILLPPETDTGVPPLQLDSLLRMIENSIVTGADRLSLSSGRIYDLQGMIVDSMYLDTRVDRGGGGVRLSIDSVSTVLPGLGKVHADGQAGLNEGLLEASGLRAGGPPGSLTLTGSLDGSSGTLNTSLAGRAGTAFLDLPLDLELSFDGTVNGPLSSPSASISFSSADACLFGRTARIQADSVYADLGQVSINGLQISTDQATLDLHGELDMETLAWTSQVTLSMTEIDPSATWDILPQGNISGTLHASGEGAADTLLRDASVAVHLLDSDLDDLRITSLQFDGQLAPGWISASGSLQLESESVAFSCSGPVSEDMTPISLSVSADASIASSTVFENFGLHGLPEFRSVSVAFEGTGASFDETMVPGSWAGELELDVGSISGASTEALESLPGLTGTRLLVKGSGSAGGGVISPETLDINLETGLSSVNLGQMAGLEGDPILHGSRLVLDARASDFSGGMQPRSWDAHASIDVGSVTGDGLLGLAGLDSIGSTAVDLDVLGSRFAISCDGGLLLDSIRFGDILLDSTSVQGSVSMNPAGLSGHVDLDIDSIRVGGDAFHLDVGIDMEGSDITADSLVVSASNGRLYSARLALRTGLITRFSIGDMRASYSKHRIVTDGALSGYSEAGFLVLDTLWIQPPVGSLGMSGLIGPDSMALNLRVQHFDLSSFRSFVALPADISGLGDFSFSLNRGLDDVRGSFTGTIDAPSYGQFIMDSLTVDITTDETALTVNGIYAWLNGVRSGLQMRISGLWDSRSMTFGDILVEWMELEINDIGDWFFYAMPLPIRTVGASISARVEYDLSAPEGSQLELQASARIERLFVTLLGIELPKVNFYISFPDSAREGYNSRLILGAGDTGEGNFSSDCYVMIDTLFPLSVGEYDIAVSLDAMEVPIPGIGAIVASGDLSSSGTGTEGRPLLSGHIGLLEGAVGIPQTSGLPSSGSSELPFNMAINITGNSDLWFRTSYADIEMAVELRLLTLENQPTVNGVVSAVRGRITLLQTDFDITEGRVEFIQGIPPQTHLNVLAGTTVRSLMNQEKYDITVQITGDAENPDINMTGTGPAGAVSQEDILTLLTVGVTYGEMQQLNSSAIRTEVENVAQSLVGNLLARSIRHEIGLDTFQISPELFADTTSLVLNVGKYILPSVYVSYKGDLFSESPGTFSLQYLFSSDLYIEGTTRSTIHGDMEPTLELHYTFRY